MRLGTYPAKLRPGSMAAAIYGAELVFEHSQLAAERRLGDVQAGRGAAEMQLLGHGDEVAEMAQFHFREHSQKL